MKPDRKSEAQRPVYWRRLPHFRSQHATYFVTWRLHGSQSRLLPGERDIVRDGVLHFHRRRYHVWAYVVMNDHVHVVFTPWPEHALQKVVHTWKSYTAHEIVRRFGHKAPVWRREYFDRILRTESEFREKVDYVVKNPWKRWPGSSSYPWAGVCNDWSWPSG